MNRMLRRRYRLSFDQQRYSKKKLSSHKDSFKLLNANNVSKMILFGATNKIQEFEEITLIAD